MKKLRQISICSLPDMLTFLVRFSPTALIQFQPIKVLVLSLSHTAGLVHSGWEKYKLAELHHIFNGANFSDFPEWSSKYFKIRIFMQKDLRGSVVRHPHMNKSEGQNHGLSLAGK